MAEIGCAAPSGLLPVQVIKNRGEPLLKTALAPKFRSPNTIFFPYKSGTIPAGTSVMWGVVLGSSLEVGPIYNIRRGVTTGVSTDKTAVVGENRICVEDLFLLTPQPLKQRNTSTQRMTRCSWRLRLIKRQSDEWEVTVFEPPHHGHPKPDPAEALHMES
jgi:hypothetical protein